MSHASHPARMVRFVRQKGFTLIELSIILAIIGLIVGGIMIGRDIIRVSQLRAVATEAGRYTQVVTDFRDKYLALPGDFAGAEALWGSDSNCPTSSSYTTTPHTATCNGDGNGRIGDYNATTYSWGGQAYEVMRAWQQLADAGLIDGQYSGVASSNAVAVIGVNVPASQVSARAGRFIIIWPRTEMRLTSIPRLMVTCLILAVQPEMGRRFIPA